MNKTRKFKIVGLPSDKEFAGMAFGRQIEHLRKIQEFQASAKSTWISQKRQSSTKAIKEAIKLLGAKEYYCEFHDEPHYRDDSFQFWYKVA